MNASRAVAASHVRLAPRHADDEHVLLAQRSRLFDLAARFHVGDLVTRAPDGILHARPMTVALLDPSAEELGFLSVVGADVVHEVSLDPTALVTFQNRRHHVVFSGRAHVDHERYRVARCWTADLEPYFPEGPDDPHLVLLVVRAIRAEYWSASALGVALQALGAAPSTVVRRGEDDPRRHGVVTFEVDWTSAASDW
jgi:general stress protein 26